MPLSELGGVDALWHTVTAGETVRAIAQQYGLTTKELLRLNPRLDARRPQEGLRVLVVAPAVSPGGPTAAAVASSPVAPPAGRGWSAPADAVLVGLATALFAAAATSWWRASREREESVNAGLLPAISAGALQTPPSSGGDGVVGGDGLLPTWPAPEVVGVPPPARRPQRYSWGGRLGTEDLARMQPDGQRDSTTEKAANTNTSKGLRWPGLTSAQSRPGRAAAAAEDMRALGFAAQRAAQDSADAEAKRKAADAASAEALARVAQRRRGGSIFGSPVGGANVKVPRIESPELFSSPAGMSPSERAQILDTARTWAASGRPQALGMTTAPRSAPPAERSVADPVLEVEEEASGAADATPSSTTDAGDVMARMRAEIARDRAPVTPPAPAVVAAPPIAVPPPAPAPSPAPALDDWQARMLAEAEAELAAERDRAIRQLEDEASRLAAQLVTQAPSPPVTPPPAPPPKVQLPSASVIAADLVRARAAAEAARAKAEQARAFAASADAAAVAAESAVTSVDAGDAALYDVKVKAISLRAAADEAAHVAAVAAAEATSLETLADVVAERMALEAQLRA